MHIRLFTIVIAAVLIVGLGIGLGITAIGQLNEASGLQRNSVQAVATVSQKWIVAGESRDQSHRVRYTFELDGENLTFERPVPVALHRVVNTGSKFEVTVSPENPDLHEIFPGQLSGTARSKLIAGLLIVGFGILVFIFGGGLDLFKRKERDV